MSVAESERLEERDNKTHTDDKIQQLTDLSLESKAFSGHVLNENESKDIDRQ